MAEHNFSPLTSMCKNCGRFQADATIECSVPRIAQTYDEKVYDLASSFLEDEPTLFTMHHNHHMACAIQAAIEQYISEATLKESAHD